MIYKIYMIYVISSILEFRLSSAVHGWMDRRVDGVRQDSDVFISRGIFGIPMDRMGARLLSPTPAKRREMEGMGEGGYPLPKCSGVISDTVLNVSNHRYFYSLILDP